MPACHAGNPVTRLNSGRQRIDVLADTTTQSKKHSNTGYIDREYNLNKQKDKGI